MGNGGDGKGLSRRRIRVTSHILPVGESGTTGSVNQISQYRIPSRLDTMRLGEHRMKPDFRFFSVLFFGLFFGSATFGQTTEPVPDVLIDLNGNGSIDSPDLLILLHRWGVEGIPTPVPSPTPNPNVVTVDIPFPTPLPIQLVRIPPGTFTLGSPDTERSRSSDEGPQHQVTISNEFFMGQTEVTQGQWKAVMGSLIGCDTEHDFGTGDNHPVYCVSWLDIQDFLVALNTLSGEGNFRLPTEAEWEYACRGGGIKRFYFGNSLGCSDDVLCEDCLADTNVVVPAKSGPGFATDLPSALEPKQLVPNLRFRSDYMWFCGNSGILSQPVRSLLPNSFGLFDMSGNVVEWVQDEYHTDYTGAPTDGSAWIGGGVGQRVQRGGAFVSTAEFCRSAKRGYGEPPLRYVNTGFRIVWTP